MNQAIAAIKEKNYSHAREILKGVIKSDPNNVDAWLLYARVAPNKDQAIQCLERVLRLDPDHPLGQKMMAQLRASQRSSKKLQPDQTTSPPHSEGVARVPAKMDAEVDEEHIQAQPASERPDKDQSRGESLQKPIIDSGKSKKGFNFTWAFIITILLVLIAGGYFAFQNPMEITRHIDNGPTPTSDELFAVIYENITAANAEDIEAYMRTIHEDSPLYGQTQDDLSKAFATYDLSYSVSDLRVEQRNASEAKVHFALTSRKIRGPNFRDNVVKGIYILRPEDGNWKLFQYEDLEVIYLD